MAEINKKQTVTLICYFLFSGWISVCLNKSRSFGIAPVLWFEADGIEWTSLETFQTSGTIRGIVQEHVLVYQNVGHVDK